MHAKRHHFLPEFYLNDFTRNGLLSVYDRKNNSYRKQTPRNTAVIGHYYAIENENGEKDYSVEEYLSQVEGRAKPVIVKLEMGQAVTVDEKFDLARFLAFLFSRTPKHEQEIDCIADAAHKIIAKRMIPTVEAAAELLKQSGHDGQTTAESMFDFIHQEKFRMKGNRNIAIDTMLDQARWITKDLMLMNWIVAHAPPSSAYYHY